jgi:ribosomal protein S18 acetylase RimI-like enzyme
MITIIEIGKDRIEIIKPLWEKLNAHHLERSIDFRKHYAEFTFEKRMESLLKRERLIAYIAKEEDRDIGYCMATADGLSGEIDSIFVEQAHRGEEIGEELLTRALSWLKSQGCDSIRVSIAKGNENVLDFYKKFGFAERLTLMQRVPTMLDEH